MLLYLEMSLESLLNDIFQGLIAHAGALHLAIVVRIETGDFILEDLVAVGGLRHVADDAVHPPPDRVTAVEPRVAPSVEQVGNEAVSETGSIT